MRGCSKSRHRIQITPTPRVHLTSQFTVDVHRSLTTVAPGSQVTLLVEAVAVPTPSFEWRLEGAPLATQPGSNTLVLDSVSTVNVGRYTAFVCNKLDCRESRPAMVRVFTAPKFETQPPSDVSVILHSELHLELDMSGIPFPSVQWYFNDQLIEGLQAATLFIPEVKLANEGRYHAVLTNNLGTSVGPDTHVDVLEPPTFFLQPAGATVNFLETFVAIVAVDGDAPFSYRWTVRCPGIVSRHKHHKERLLFPSPSIVAQCSLS